MAISSTAEAGVNDAVLVGVVRDATTSQGVEGAVVIVTGEKVQGERTMTTNVSGLYRIPNLPPGTYNVTVLHKDFAEGQKRTGLQLRAGTTIRVDVFLQPAGKDVVNVEVPAPTIDIGSSATGLNIDKEMARRVPIAQPTAKGGANRSFESVAEATPGASGDLYGTSVAGTTSPENKYYVDGLSVNDTAFGLNGTGLSVEFIEEVRVEAGGYMPEHGRSTGGIVNAVTKTGSNEFHGGVWAFYTPGQLEGRREIPQREGSSIRTERNLSWLGDAGFDVGGRIVKDKLWFYGGVSVSRTRYNVDTAYYRNLVRLENGPVDPETMMPEYQRGDYIRDPDTNFLVTERIANTATSRKAQSTSVQALGKLTYTPVKGHTLELLGIYAPSLSGGNGTYGISQATGLPEVNQELGTYNALARRRRDSSTDLQLKHNWVNPDGKWNIDTIVGWHHQTSSSLPVDGSRLGGGGLAATPGVIYRQNNPEFHSLTDPGLANLPSAAPGNSCDPFLRDPMGDPMDPANRVITCPVTQYTTGGPGFLFDRKIDRGQARLQFTRLARAAGSHVIKFGADFEYMSYNSNRGYSGGTLYREGTGGTNYADFREYAFLSGPDNATIMKNLNWHVYSTTIGGYLQDSWNIMDRVTLNAGLRYDAQHLFSGDKTLAMALPNQLSPRAGLIWDPTQNGKAKLFVNYARFFQSVPLNLADRAGSGEPGLQSVHTKMGCDPTMLDSHNGGCQDDANRLTLGGPTSPDQLWVTTGAGKTPIDGRLKPQSSDEIVAGAEYQIFPNGRLGLAYTHRWLNKVIEDMSRDEAATYFIGNPGYGIAKDFPKAKRVYDAVNVYIEKRFTRNWMITGSYTLSFLRGNIAGLFRPETGQLDPNITSDFDLISLLDNRTGYLPGDTRHVFKVFTAGEINLGNGNSLLLGGAFRANSGGPTDALASHVLYGFDEAFLIPRGTGPRMPWNFRVDGNIGYRKFLTKDVAIAFTMDVFNIFNFQQMIAVDNRYTFSDVRPIAGLTLAELNSMEILDVEGAPIVKNPNYGRPTVFQQPRMFRFGIRLTF